MKLSRLALVIPTTLILFAGCTGEPTKAPEPGKAAGGSMGADNGDDHGTPHELGEATLGAVQIRATQFGNVMGGYEVPVDLHWPAKATLPSTVRGWIGSEDAVGSRKGRFDLTGDEKFHGHLEAPVKLMDDAKLWVEIEQDAGAIRTSFALER